MYYDVLICAKTVILLGYNISDLSNKGYDTPS